MADRILQTDESFQRILDDIRCNLGSWEFKFNFRKHNESPYLQIVFWAPDSMTGGEPEEQFCRKWALQYTMSKSEVVRTAHMAAAAAFDHERDEAFTYRGLPVYSPHTDIESLWDMRRASNYKDDIRIPEDKHGGICKSISDMDVKGFADVVQTALNMSMEKGDNWAYLMDEVLSAPGSTYAWHTFLDKLKTALANDYSVDSLLTVFLKNEPSHLMVLSGNVTAEVERLHRLIAVINEDSASFIHDAIEAQYIEAA